MTDLEQHLTDLMTARAEQAPDDLGLLSRVHAASTRRTRVRRWTAFGAAVAAVAGVALGASVLTGGKPAADRFTDPTGFLVDGRGLALRLPFTPSPLPADYRFGIPDILQYDDTTVAQWLRSDGFLVEIQVQGKAPAGFTPGRERVNGAPAQTGCGNGGCSVAFLREPGQFVTVKTGRTTAEPLAVARGLIEEDYVLRPTLVLGLVPARGCYLSTPRSKVLTTLQPVGSQVGSPCPVDASVGDTDKNAGRSGTVKQTRIGGYRATLYEYAVESRPGVKPPAASAKGADVRWAVTIHLKDGRYLNVNVPKRNGWNRTELDRFVRAIIVPPKG